MSLIKRITIWLYCHHIISSKTTERLFRVFNMRAE